VCRSGLSAGIGSGSGITAVAAPAVAAGFTKLTSGKGNPPSDIPTSGAVAFPVAAPGLAAVSFAAAGLTVAFAVPLPSATGESAACAAAHPSVPAASPMAKTHALPLGRPAAS